MIELSSVLNGAEICNKHASLAERSGQNDIHCVRLSYCSAPIVLPDLSFPFRAADPNGIR